MLLHEVTTCGCRERSVGLQALQSQSCVDTSPPLCYEQGRCAASGAALAGAGHRLALQSKVVFTASVSSGGMEELPWLMWYWFRRAASASDCFENFSLLHIAEESDKPVKVPGPIFSRPR